MKCLRLFNLVFSVLALGLAGLKPMPAAAEDRSVGAGVTGSINVRDQFKGTSRPSLIQPIPARTAPKPPAAASTFKAPAPAPAAAPSPAPAADLADRVVDAQSLLSPQIVNKLTLPTNLEQPRIAEEAPDSFKCMALANQKGDKETARRCADMYVMYMANLMFQVRELTQMIGESLVRVGIVKEEDWVGAEQYMNRELALARQEESTPFQATNEMVLKRIKPDPNEQAEVYFFCTLTNNFCREMTPNVERLWRMTKNDPKVKLATVLIAESQPEYINSFREYTGLTAPVYVGPDLAKKLRIGFVPAIVVRAPGSGKIYTKTGFQSFERMYQFVRSVQGRSIEITPAVKQMAAIPIGFEKGAKGFDWSKVSKQSQYSNASGQAGANPPVRPVVGKF